MTDSQPCASRLGHSECHLPIDHDGQHQALHLTVAGTYIEVLWTEEYQGVATQPWLASLRPDVDTTDDMAWVVYGQDPAGWANPAWNQS